MKIAIVTASGIGDGLILHIASHHLMLQGHVSVTFNDHLKGFGKWMGEAFICLQPALDEIEKKFSHFDAVILQHDNSEKAKRIRNLSLPVFTFYGSHQLAKHGPLSQRDFVCDPTKTMVDNLVHALEVWFGKKVSKENGLKAPEGLVARKYRKRVAIHPVSSSCEKNWPFEKFLRVAKNLEKWGAEPVFLIDQGGKALCPDLESLASFLYESGAFLGLDSGPGHLASYLELPSCIVAPNAKQMQSWQPGWRPATVMTPPLWVSSLRWSRKYWARFISEKSVYNVLNRCVLCN